MGALRCSMTKRTRAIRQVYTQSGANVTTRYERKSVRLYRFHALYSTLTR